MLALPLALGTLRAEFRAGAAARIVTPEPLLPVSGGMGPSKPAHTQKGELTVRALVVENQGTRLALVSADFLGVPSVLGDRIRAKVSGIPATHILIGASHTHSAPDLYAFPDGAFTSCR
jgi:predicted neutral ceramidase superfamily lipid hydrolase